jgi:hypothetical protein
VEVFAASRTLTASLPLSRSHLLAYAPVLQLTFCSRALASPQLDYVLFRLEYYTPLSDPKSPAQALLNCCIPAQIFTPFLYHGNAAVRSQAHKPTNLPPVAALKREATAPPRSLADIIINYHCATPFAILCATPPLGFKGRRSTDRAAPPISLNHSVILRPPGKPANAPKAQAYPLWSCFSPIFPHARPLPSHGGPIHPSPYTQILIDCASPRQA